MKNLKHKVVIKAHTSLVEEQGDCSYCVIQKSLEDHFNDCFSLSELPSMNELNTALSCMEEFADIVACRETSECDSGYYYNNIQVRGNL